MRMKNRLCRMGQTLLGAACLLSTFGLTYSCSDDYDLPDKTPDFLGASIYDELKSRGNFTTMVRLIEDLGQKDVLSKTGSKTLFVADDAAFADFFAHPIWVTGTGDSVKSYEQLSMAQKRLLFNNSMLDNAYLLEMMPNAGSTSGITKNTCLRQATSAANTDSISWWNPVDLPHTYNKDEKDYWAFLNNPVNNPSANGRGVLMATDNTVPWMTHFMLGQMNMQGITTDDVSFILGLTGDAAWPAGARRNYINNVEVRSERDAQNRYQSDVTCLNGYFNVLDKVMVPPSNMAEEIRKCPETSYFSHMLDRFSAPFPDMALRQAYLSVYGEQNTPDTVYQKRYFSSWSQGGALTTDPDGLQVNDGVLNYDPGWNQYGPESGEAATDMAAMFVPSNDALVEFFTKGQGLMFIERYSSLDLARTNFLEAIDQIPKNRLEPLINNLMKTSFNASVPSKYLSIMNDARDPMFSGFNATQYRNLISKCLLANNGVVYVMNQVIAPAQYASVAGPALVSDQSQIVNAVITADDRYVQGSQYGSAPMKQYFSTYLKAMSSRFSFFIPTDEALGKYGYVDPATYMVRANRRYWRFTYDNSSNNVVIPVRAVAYRYDPATGPLESDRQISGNVSEATEALTSSSNWGETKRYLLTEMINQHIVVHEGSQADKGVNGDANYYLSRSGAPVYVKSKDNDNLIVQGGLQLMMNSSSEYTGDPVECKVVETFDQTGLTADGEKGYGNGMTYLIDRPMQPTMTSAYTALSSNSNCSTFFGQASYNNPEILDKAGFTTDDMSSTEKDTERNKYIIFENNRVQDYDVTFFNNYRYTIYVPTNEAMAYAHDVEGLPTWEEIEEWVNANCDPDLVTDPEQLAANQAIAQAKILCLVNFLRYHFQDESIFVDNVTAGATDYETSCVNRDENVYLKINVTQSPNSIALRDESGVNHMVSTTNNNVLVRDNKDVMPTGGSASSKKYVASTSYAVVHELSGSSADASDEGFLYFMPKKEGGHTFSSAWETAAQAKSFVKKYAIRK